MTECPHNRSGCTFNEQDETSLVAGIMSFIERFGKKNRRTPCPLCLRDTMLATAALLHLKAAEHASGYTGKPKASRKRMGDEFARAARERLTAVIEADAILKIGASTKRSNRSRTN
jgi:hypothetical protein